MGLPTAAWCADGDTFTAETKEGAVVTYRVLSEDEKTCQIGGALTPRYTNYVAIKDYTGDVTIPSEVNGYTVTLIKFNAFGATSDIWVSNTEDANLHINRLQLPETITTIEEGAFYSGDIKHVNWPSKAVCEGAPFSNCTNLETVDLPEGITELPAHLFDFCTSPVTESFVIPATVKNIGENCFANSNLKSIVIPATVEFVGSRAFNDCDLLTSAVVESAATNLGDYVFGGCEQLTEFTFPEGTTNVPTGILYGTTIAEVNLPATVTTIGYGAFSSCKALKSINLPEGLTTIDGAFDSSGLTSIVLPSTLTGITNRAFYDCPLTEITSRIVEPFSIESDIFGKDIYKTAKLYVPEGSVELYKNTPAWSQFYGIYPDISTGISKLQNLSQTGNGSRYTLDGRKAVSGQRGLQIVKQADGRVVKTFVR